MYMMMKRGVKKLRVYL